MLTYGHIQCNQLKASRFRCKRPAELIKEFALTLR